MIKIFSRTTDYYTKTFSQSILTCLLSDVSSDDDDLKKAIKLSLQDSGLTTVGSGNSQGHTDSSLPSQQKKQSQDSDSDSEYDFCI